MLIKAQRDSGIFNLRSTSIRVLACGSICCGFGRGQQTLARYDSAERAREVVADIFEAAGAGVAFYTLPDE